MSGEMPKSVETFACSASFARARAFVAACVERTAGVLFWAAAESGAEAAPEACFQALDLLWESGPVDEERVSELYDALGELLEEASESPVEGAEAIAAEGTDVLRTGLGFLLWGNPEGASQISLAVREFVSELGERCDVDLLEREDEAQNRDVVTLTSWGDGSASPDAPSSLRAAASEVGREYLAAAVARYRGGTGSAGAPEASLRVYAVLDRSAVIAKHAAAPRHYGVVGRIVAGRGAGRYLRVDRQADLAETPYEPEELGEPPAELTGVSIRVADDPAMESNCVGEWVEDWAAVEETFERDGRRVDWPSR
ncbi:hypothetical protein [Streptomyces sp. NPDC000410]|uniref:hypothetical protein n=1 Tax=Streptomyces sp. NPDC000410 TaxID=3154254 RepID=UPI00332C358A